jgi:hypothetical protein
VGNPPPGQIRGRSNNDESECAREAHLDHVALDDIAQAHARVVAISDNVHQAIFDDHFDIDPRVAFAKAG